MIVLLYNNTRDGDLVNNENGLKFLMPLAHPFFLVYDQKS